LQRPSGRRVGTKKQSGAPLDAAPQAVFLVGFMGAGKSTVGRTLAKRLKWLFEDLDDRIERREARTVPEIFRTTGEQEFRRAERDALLEVLKELRSGGSARIVALGGGAFVQPANAVLLKAARVPIMFLDAPVDELWQRCQKQASTQGTVRPLLSSMDRFSDLYRARRQGYLQASRKIETGGRTVEAVAEEIASALLEKKGKGDR
jgi:shikimate kinase